MHENHGLRLTFVGAILFGALAIVFSPVLVKLRHPSEKLTQIVNLKPGIDMVGGTSLVYEIKKPDNTRLNGKLASEVAERLKQLAVVSLRTGLQERAVGFEQQDQRKEGVSASASLKPCSQEFLGGFALCRRGEERNRCFPVPVRGIVFGIGF